MVKWKFWEDVVVRRPWEDKLEHVMRVSRKEMRYFLRIHHIAEEMLRLVEIAKANKLATGDVNRELRSNKGDDDLRRRLAIRQGRDDEKIREINQQLGLLKRFEVREQLIASVGKLETSVKNLFDLIESKIGASHEALRIRVIGVQNRIKAITTRMSVFEGNVLLKTKKDLGNSVKGGEWGDAEGILKEILNNIAAFAQLDRELERHLRGVDQLLQRGQQQGQRT